ncbi:MAG: class I SAM-dependent methyltransferase, partial [Sphingomonas sp.]
MRQSLVAAMIAATVFAGVTTAVATKPTTIAQAVAAPTRTPANVLRDKYRHPAETLKFFGVKSNQTIVEIWPGGGWYTEILAPLTKGQGKYWAASLWPDGNKRAQSMQTADPATYGHIQFAAFPWAEGQPKVPDGSADVVLTFRNVHNFRMGYQRGGVDYSAEAFAQMFRMLKKGGTLGIVDHRLPESASDDRE